MLKVTDLTASKELDSKEMAGVVGGTSEMERFSALLDFSTSISNKVADTNQGFGFGLSQANVGTVSNTQVINGGNGVVYAPVRQEQSQANYMGLLGIGNTAVV